MLICQLLMLVIVFFFFSSRRRHTRCALVTGVQTCALPIFAVDLAACSCAVELFYCRSGNPNSMWNQWKIAGAPSGVKLQNSRTKLEIGRASCRERVCQYV